MAGLQYIGFLLTVHIRSLSLLQIGALESPDIGLNREVSQLNGNIPNHGVNSRAGSKQYQLSYYSSSR